MDLWNLGPALPTETLHYIGGFLVRDPRALQTASLVARSWYTGVRPHLYRTVTLHSEAKVQDMEVLVKRCPTIAYWVRELRVSAFTKSTRWHADSENWSRWITHITRELPEKLVNVHTIELVGLHNPYIYGNHRSLCNHKMIEVIPKLTSFRSVRSLTFFRCELDNDVAGAFMDAFTHLSEVHLCKSVIMAAPVGNDHPSPPPRPPRFKSLSIDDNYDALRNFHLADTVGSLEKLRMRVTGEHLSVVSDFIAQLGPSLLELHLAITMPGESSHPLSSIPNVGNLSGLRLLCIGPLFNTITLSCLSTITSQHIKHISICLTTSCLRHLSRDRCLEYDRYLSVVASNPSLEALFFSHPSESASQEVEEVLLVSFPSLFENMRGIIRVIRREEDDDAL